MKKLKYPIILSALAASSVLFAADYNFITDNGIITDVANWQVDGSPASDLPGATDNVTFDNLWIRFNVEQYPAYVFEVNNMTLLNNARFDPPAGNDTSNWNTKAPSLKIYGNLIANGSDVCIGRYGREQFQNVYIGEDFIVSRSLKLAFNRTVYDNYDANNPSLRLQGQLKIQDSGSYTAHSIMLDYATGSTSIERAAYYKIGGLDSSEATTVRLRNGNETTPKTFIEFAAADNGKYNGEFQGGYFRGFIGILGQTSPGFEITMNDQSGGTNKQVICLDPSQKEGADKISDIFVTVKNGHLELYGDASAISGSTGLQTLKLEGGKFGITGANISARTGMAKFVGDLTWTAGKIEITADIDNMEADVLEVNNLILADSDATYEFVFDMLGDFDETTIMHLNILTLTGEGSTFGDDIISKLVGKTSDGLYNAIFSLNAGNNKLYLDGFSQIPEPAEVAAFIGAVALAFAAWRRRK